MACPFSALYGATKAFLTEFAISIAPEVRIDGIGVCVVHPSPVASNFYTNQPSVAALLFFKSTAVGPTAIVNSLFSSVGHTVIRDQGYYPLAVRLLLKVLDSNLMADITTRVAHNLGDFKKFYEPMKTKSS